ncbi:hypothetical protein JCM10450v2_006847 [Rhodotorula kratochvilovae]
MRTLITAARRWTETTYGWAEPRDLMRIAAVNRAAFASSLHAQRMLGDLDTLEQRAAILAPIEATLLDPQCETFKAVRDGEIVGYATWDVPLYVQTAEDRAREFERRTGGLRRDWPATMNVPLLREMLVKTVRHHLALEEPHYHLAALAVDPKHQRTGVASGLLHQLGYQADLAGVAARVYSEEQSISTYLAAGYEHIDEPIVSELDRDVVTYPMHRLPLTCALATSADLPFLAPIQRTVFSAYRPTAQLFLPAEQAAYDEWFVRRFLPVFEGGRRTRGSEMLVARRGEQRLGFVHAVLDAGAARYHLEETGEGIDANEAFFEETLMIPHRLPPFPHWALKMISVTPGRSEEAVSRRLLQLLFDRVGGDGSKVFLGSTEPPVVARELAI